MTMERESVPFLLLSVAEGSIAGSVETHPRLDEFTDRVGSGEFHIGTPIALPCGCKDGRCGGEIRPNGAGGTLSLVVADDLLRQDFAGDGTTVDAARKVFRHLIEAGHPVGGHCDAKADDIKSGCGANDKLPIIYSKISGKSAEIRALVESLGYNVDDSTHTDIVAGAQRRMQFSSGREVLDVMREEGGEENVDKLRGEHNEVLAVINSVPGTTLNRDAVVREFGEYYQSFNTDTWSFEAGARALYPEAGDAEIQRAVIAMVYYNLATALTLCGPTMRVVVRS